MKKIILLLAFGISSILTFAQGNITVAGIVMDEAGVELIGVSIKIKGTTTGVVTDYDGRFKLENIPVNSIVEYSYIGYLSREKKYGKTELKEQIVLKENITEFDEVVITGRGAQRKVSVVGAVTSVDPGELQAPAVSVSNMLGGRVPGIIAVTRSGEPGNNFSEFWIRGISTFGASQSALVLIDGVEGNINDLDPADIESFSILKDASATAVYGTRGANGVVVVTTKRGKAGKLKINFKTNATYSYSPRMPEYTNGYDYARLANESRAVRGDEPVYSPVELELFRTGLDPDLYPDVNWRDVILKDHVWNDQHHLSVAGGGQNARYYLSLGMLNSEAVFKQDKSANKHNTNVDYHKYNFRANVDANLTQTTEISLNIDAAIKKRNAPGEGSNNDALWAAQANLPPTIVPVKYSNGQLPSYGTNADEMSPYVRLNYTGFTSVEEYSTKINMGLKQNLDILTKGLTARGLISFKMNGVHVVHRMLNPDLFYADRKDGRYADGSLKTWRKLEKKNLDITQDSASDRELYVEAATDYNRVFGDAHRITGLLHFYRQEFINSRWGGDSEASRILAAIPQRYQALSGRATYSYEDTYMLEGNLGYTGSENFEKSSRYGWFPSIAVGWVPTQYKFMKDKLSFISFLKFRASYGKVGNDRLNIRFPYLTLMGSGNNGPWGGSSIRETQIGARDLKWETSTKRNFGIDGRLFNDKIDFVIDFFHTKTDGIFQQRANIPEEAGLSNALPYTNIGSMKSWGTDGTLAYTHTFNKDMVLTMRGNLTFAKNEVIYWEQSGVNFPYQAYSGHPYGVSRGLISLGLFADEDDVRSSPKQTYMDNVLPGDIKYKDVNGDGVINDDDVVPISYSNVPQVQYGFAFDFSYKAFRISALFEGISKVEYFLGGTGYYPFAYESRGNLLNIVADQKNRWTPASYSGTKETENPDARFPRLTYGENKNNNRASTFWLADGRYFRFKNIDISYRFTHPWLLSRLGMESATLSLVGENLHVWDKVKLWDPGQASANGGVYPLQRLYTIQLNLTF